MEAWYRVEDADRVTSPAVLVYPDRIEKNLQRLIRTAGGVHRLRPHVNTHKMPTIVQMELSMGITRFKASSLAGLEMTAMAGGEDVLLAFQPVGPNQRQLLELVSLYPHTHFSTIVDDFDCARSLSNVASKHNHLLDVYLDIDVGLHRTGIDVDSAIDFYNQIDALSHLRVIGLHAYEGQLAVDGDRTLQEAVETTFAPVWRLRDKLLQHNNSHYNNSPCHVVAGATPTMTALSDHDGVEIGAGSAVLWDVALEDSSPPLGFEPAAALLTRVISRPTKDHLCLDLGHKAVASESPTAQVQLLDLPDATTVMHTAEHMVVHTRQADRWPVGSVMYALPCRICSTIAQHTEVSVVQDHHLVDRWMVVQRHRRLSI